MKTDVSLIEIYLFPTGRRLVAFEGTLAALDEEGLTPEQKEKEAPLRARLEAAIEYDQATFALEGQYYGQSSRARHAAEAPLLDAKIDRMLTAVERTLDDNVRAFPESSVVHQASRVVKRALLPQGAAAIRTLEYEQADQAIQVLFKEAARGDLPQKIEEAKVGHHLDELRVLHAEFKGLIGVGQKGMIGFDKVRAARSVGQRNLAKIIAWVLGHYLEDDEADVEARTRLLAAIGEENDKIGDEYRRYGIVRDVDPKTGNPADGNP